jgi:hypothetical protein
MSASTLPTTLKSITATKIVELKKQRRVFEESKSAIGQEVKQRKLGLEKTQALVDGTSRLESVRILTDSESDDDAVDYSRSSKAGELRNARRLLHQASVDPAFPGRAVEKIFHDITTTLDLKSVQHQHAQFFSELVTEWISNPEGEVASMDTDSGPSSFEKVGREEMHEQRAEWERIVFNKTDIDVDALNAYLEKLFKSHKPVTKAHDDMRRAISAFCHALKNDELFDTDSLKVAIKGLIASDLLSDDKKAILKTFSSNREVLKEVADVLNMRFNSLETWNWTNVNSAIYLEQRRQLNGKYRVFMDEDVLDALLIHVIGMRWANEFKSRFTVFFNTYAWQRSNNVIPLADRERREWFLGQNENVSKNVPNARREAYARDYFMTQLPETMAEGYRGYDDESDDGVRPRKNPLEIKHGLLHLLITETLLARHLRANRPYTVIRSDFKWFGPSLSHETIFTILNFFGVDDFWLGFFRKFLETPLRFVQDGEDGEVKIRARGVPMSHALSDVLSETTLFVMDFAVNSATRTNLYRLHDDFWFWGSTDICKRAWHEMKVFCSVTGIEFNEEKTGSVTFQPRTVDSYSDTDLTDTTPGLPTGDVRWGFLRLNANTVRFEIDQSMVDEHIKELKYQLDGCTSLFSYVQSYNSYLARFFSNNFGKPSFGFGRQHLDAMISTLTRIQNAMFPNGRVTDHLGKEAIRRFKLEGNLPDGFWYFPVAMGGMELRNPLVPLFGMRDSIRRSPEHILQKALEADEAAYLVDKERYERTNSGAGLGKYNAELKVKMMNSGDVDQFMSRDEYLKFREECSFSLRNAYDTLLCIPDEKPVESTTAILGLLDTLPKSAGRNRGRGTAIQKNFNNMDPYWQWIVAVHGPEVVKMFGGLQMVDQEQVPLGVVSVMKAGKIRWRG